MKTKIERIGLALLIVCLFGRNACSQQTEGINPQLLKTLVSVEQITGFNAAQSKIEAQPIGSAFLVGTPRKHLILVTAKHVITESDGKLKSNLAYRINNRKNNSDLIPEEHMKLAGDWFFSSDTDVACRFIAFGDPDIAAFALTDFLSQKTIQPGAPIVVIGFPLGLRSESYAVGIVRKGIVAYSDKNSLLLDAFTFPGNSGGPVIYSSSLGNTIPMTTSATIAGNALIGLISGYIPYTDVALSQQTKRPRVSFEENSGLTTVIPAEAILELIQRDDLKRFEEKLKP